MICTDAGCGQTLFSEESRKATRCAKCRDKGDWWRVDPGDLHPFHIRARSRAEAVRLASRHTARQFTVAPLTPQPEEEA